MLDLIIDTEVHRKLPIDLGAIIQHYPIDDLFKNPYLIDHMRRSPLYLYGAFWNMLSRAIVREIENIEPPSYIWEINSNGPYSAISTRKIVVVGEEKLNIFLHLHEIHGALVRKRSYVRVPISSGFLERIQEVITLAEKGEYKFSPTD